jgi:Zn-dependent protease with chaperone function
MHSQAIRTHNPLKSMIFIVAAALLGMLVFAPVSAENNDPEYLRESASRMLGSLIQSVFEGDFTSYTRDFSPAMKKAQDREAFLLLQRNLQKSLGKLKTMEYLGSYRQLGENITLFKGRFSKEKDDVLIKLVLEEHGGEYQVTGLWFDAPSLEK